MTGKQQAGNFSARSKILYRIVPPACKVVIQEFCTEGRIFTLRTGCCTANGVADGKTTIGENAFLAVTNAWMFILLWGGIVWLIAVCIEAVIDRLDDQGREYRRIALFAALYLLSFAWVTAGYVWVFSLVLGSGATGAFDENLDRPGV